MRLSALLSYFGLSALAIALTGCTAGGIAPSANLAIRGNVHGGQQPIIGATVQLWAAGMTDTSGNATSPNQLLVGTVTTDSHGSFTLTGDYTCPSSNSLVYITSRGGDAGAGNNPQIAMMSLLGPCGSLTPSTFIWINEETTVVAAETIIGTTEGSFDTNSNITGTFHDNGVTLASAFSLALEFVNPATGVVPGPAAPQEGSSFVPLINTFADILAACINSGGGVAGDGSPCGNLFAETTYPGGTNSTTNQTIPPGPVPTDTLQAIVDYIIYSGENGSMATGYGANLYLLIPPDPPYLPDLQSTPPALFPQGVTLLAATSTGDGIVHIPFSTQGTGAFAVAVQLATPPATILTISTSPVAGTPAAVTVCQTNPNTSQCLATPAASVSFAATANTTYTFSVFVTATAPIVSNRLYVNLTDSNSNLIGSTSVLLTTN